MKQIKIFSFLIALLCTQVARADIECKLNPFSELKSFPVITTPQQCGSYIKEINENHAVISSCACKRYTDKLDPDNETYLAACTPYRDRVLSENAGVAESVYAVERCPAAIKAVNVKCCANYDSMLSKYAGMINKSDPIFIIDVPTPPANSCVVETRNYNNARSTFLARVERYSKRDISAWNRENDLHERAIRIQVQKIRAAEAELIKNMTLLGFTAITNIVTSITGSCKPEDQRNPDTKNILLSFCKDNGEGKLFAIVRNYSKALGKKNGAVKTLLDTEKTWRGRLSRSYNRLKSAHNDMSRFSEQVTRAYTALRTCTKDTRTCTNTTTNTTTTCPDASFTIPAMPGAAEFIVKSEGCVRVPFLGGLFCGSDFWCGPTGSTCK